MTSDPLLNWVMSLVVVMIQHFFEINFWKFLFFSIKLGCCTDECRHSSLDPMDRCIHCVWWWIGDEWKLLHLNPLLTNIMMIFLMNGMVTTIQYYSFVFSQSSFVFVVKHRSLYHYLVILNVWSRGQGGSQDLKLIEKWNYIKDGTQKILWRR